DLTFRATSPPGTTERNTTRTAADWVTDPVFGAKSGRRVLRQANSFFHEDAIQPKGIMVPEKGRFEAWLRLDPSAPPGAVAVQVSGGMKVWWGKETATAAPYAGGSLGTRIGDLPKPGEWAKLAITT